MRVTLLLAVFPSLRDYYRALGRLDADGWDVETFADRAHCYHPAAPTERTTRIRLAMAGVGLRLCRIEADGAWGIVG